MKSCIVVLSSTYEQDSNVLLPNRFSKQLSLKKMGSPGHRTKFDSFMQFLLGMKIPFLLTGINYHFDLFFIQPSLGVYRWFGWFQIHVFLFLAVW